MEKNKLPNPPRLRDAIGPSIILLGLGLGSGELILWPYLVSKFGLGIIWAAVVGITAQFFINMEIERYSLLCGESIFAGFSRISKKLPYWFIFSTFIAWMWPGIIATSAKIFATSLGIERFDYLAIAFLILIGLILTLGPTLYKTVESFQKYLIFVGVPLIALITFLVAKNSDYSALSKGIIGIGEGYKFLPKDIPLFTFLGALAYSGAGGNLNLAQSFYIKEKGYGMCAGMVGISSIILKKASKISIFGQRADFEDKENMSRFKKWWILTNAEHFIVFLFTGGVTILLLALLAYASTKGNSAYQGVDFLIHESKVIAGIISPYFGSLFITIVGLMLFGTQLTVMDSTSRIISENIVIIREKLNLTKTYYTVLWLQILASIIIFLTGYSDPVSLVVTGAVINAFAMVVHIAMTFILNRKILPKNYQASTLRKTILLAVWLFFVILGLFAIVEAIKPLIG